MGHLLKIKCLDSRLNVHILASASVTFTLTTVQVPILALTHTKRITVSNWHILTFRSTLLEEVAVEGGSRIVNGVPVVIPANKLLKIK